MDHPHNNQYDLIDDDSVKIIVQVINPLQIKSTLSNYMVYTIKGTDRQSQFQITRRYSDFIILRQSLLNRWPGCFIPALPRKKIIGKSQAAFVEFRRLGLQIFCQGLAKLKHLWYSNEFQTFIKKVGDVEKIFKQLPNESIRDICKKYQGLFNKMSGKICDTMVLGNSVNFHNYIKQTLPILETLKQMVHGFLQARINSNGQYGVFFNYLMPQFQKNCLSQYVNQLTQGKFILADANNDKITQYIHQLKQQLDKKQFQQIYLNIDLQQRQLQSFLDIFKNQQQHQIKLNDLKNKQKQLIFQQQKLAAGKQGLFKSLFKSNIQDQKKQVQKNIQQTKQDIVNYTQLCQLISIILGNFEIDRFKKNKIKKHFNIIYSIGQLQQKITQIRIKIYDHILQNHNLM